jgi:carbonic anhydrase
MVQTQEAPPAEAPPEVETPPAEGEAEETTEVIRVTTPSRPRPIILLGVAIPALLLSFIGSWFAGRAAVPPPVVKHAEWGYEGAEGPAAWAELDPTFATCATGERQSPIDIAPARLNQIDWLSPIRTTYKVAKIKLINNGHVPQANFEAGSKMNFLGKDFDLKQVHAHAPSEHTIAGRATDMELHMVHASASGELAVLGIMVVEGPENPVLARFWNQIPAQAGPEVKSDVSFNPEELLPRGRRYFTYDGSLTTPPCSEGVNWVVFKDTVTASKAQIQRVKDLFHGHNNRPVQPVHDRFVREELPPAAGAPAAIPVGPSTASAPSAPSLPSAPAPAAPAAPAAAGH